MVSTNVHFPNAHIGILSLRMFSFNTLQEVYAEAGKEQYVG